LHLDLVLQQRHLYLADKEERLMKDVMKGMVLMSVLMYWLSPVDAAPGPIDDIIVLLLGLASRKQLADND